jgi:hypothetical protein
MTVAERFLTFDRISLNKSRIRADDENELVVSAVIASEIVHKYEDGMAYKPALELERAAWTADGRWVKILDHPVEGMIQKISDISGQIQNVQFVKNLKDHTGRPKRRGIVADIHFFKHNRDKAGATPVPSEIIERIKSGDLSDVSIGFTYAKDETPGEFEGAKYNYVQRDFFFDHVAAPIEEGRCPAPYCGIGCDSLPGPRLIGRDPWEEGEEYIRSGHRSSEGFDPDSMRTIDITEGVRAIVGCPKGQYTGGRCKVGMEVLSYLFSKAKFTMSEAKAWYEEHKGDSLKKIVPLGTSAIDCPICDKIDELGTLEFSTRLVRAFGKDIILDAVGSDSTSIYTVTITTDQEPRSEEERAKAHFNISDEEWKKLSDEEKQAYIAKLPPRGSAEEDLIKRARDAVEKARVALNALEILS